MKSNAEQARHNRAVEEQLKPGSGVVSDVVGKIPVIGNFLGSFLQKISLGYADINEFQNGGCVCKKNFRVISPCKLRSRRGLVVERSTSKPEVVSSNPIGAIG